MNNFHKKAVLFAIVIVIGFLTISGENQRLGTSKIDFANQFDSTKQNGEVMEEKVVRTEEEWKKILTPEEYNVLRQKGTERAFTGKYDKHFDEGVYKCAACDNVLFESDTKYDSGCGWPSFFTPLAKDRVIYEEDRSYGMVRTEVMCAKCGGHLGHVFDDGPEPTGLRYCMNSVSLKFEKKEE